MKILLPVEDPLFASALIEFTSNHKWPENTQIHVLHVVEPFLVETSQSPAAFSKLLSISEKELFESSKKLVEEVSGELEFLLPNVQITNEVRVGRVITEIVQLAREGNYDLIIACSHGKNALNRLMLGSVSIGLASVAPCAVLIVKPEAALLNEWNAIPQSAKEQLSVSQFMHR